jgi:hypothetical protein
MKRMPNVSRSSKRSRKPATRDQKEAWQTIETAMPGAQFPLLRPEEMTVLLKVLKRNRKKLMSYPGVHKVDVGYRWKKKKLTGEVAIRAHVRKKKSLPELAPEKALPAELDGYRVDVIETNFELHLRTDRLDPILGGVEARNVNLDKRGTVGAIVFDRENRPMALSNHHIFVANRPNGAQNDRINQPGTTALSDRIGAVMRSNRNLDCAVAAIDTTRQISTSIVDIPGGIKGVVDPVIGMRVTKSGLGTLTTFGMVEGVTANEFTIVPIPGQFHELSGGGDSGSIWLEQISHAAVGLHFAGETVGAPDKERAFAKIISRAASALDIKLRRKSTLNESSQLGPAAATLGGVLLLGWVSEGSLELNFMSSRDGSNFGVKATPGEISPTTPALTVFRNRYVTAWVGAGNNRISVMQSDDGSAWTGKVTLGETSQSAPALTVFNDQLYVAWRNIGDDSLNVMRSNDGLNWQDKLTISSETTHSGPALAGLGPQLLLGWRGAGDNQINLLRSADGASFFGKVTLNETTASRPALHVHGGRCYLAWQGVGNQRLNVLESSNGFSWQNKLILRESCLSGPALATLGNDFVWNWIESDSPHRLSALLYEL